MDRDKVVFPEERTIKLGEGKVLISPCAVGEGGAGLLFSVHKEGTSFPVGFQPEVIPNDMEDLFAIISSNIKGLEVLLLCVQDAIRIFEEDDE